MNYSFHPEAEKEFIEAINYYEERYYKEQQMEEIKEKQVETSVSREPVTVNRDEYVEQQADNQIEQNIEKQVEMQANIQVVPPLSLSETKKIIEALLLVSDKPLSIQKLESLLEIQDSKTIRGIINELKEEYDKDERSFKIFEIAGGYQIYTREKYSPWIKKLVQSRMERKLSPSLLETLAIIAYKQPVTRLEIEAIRGVGVSHTIKTLMEKKLVRITGKKEGIGKTLLYGTTKEFLIYFGLKGLTELPQLNELKEIMKNEVTTSQNL